MHPLDVLPEECLKPLVYSVTEIQLVLHKKNTKTKNLHVILCTSPLYSNYLTCIC